MEKVWKDIQGYEGLYQVSNLGNVKSLNYKKTKQEKLLTPKINNRGRLWVELKDKGRKRNCLIHRIVAQAFIENPNNYPQINHIDENPKNNRVDNLEWCTGKYNMRAYYDNHKGEIVRHRRNGFRHIGVWSYQKIKQIGEGETLFVWNNVRDIELTKKYRASSIIECCKGKRKTAYGFTWQFAD